VRVIHAGILMPAASQLATVSPARADDSVAAAGDAAASAAGAAADTAVAPAPSGGFLINFTNALPDDPVITVLFYTAITILSVVTLGVRCRDVPCTAEMCPQAVSASHHGQVSWICTPMHDEWCKALPLVDIATQSQMSLEARHVC